MTKLHLDFETRSTAELKEVGLDNYARHPDTEPWCLAWAFGDDEPALWVPGGPPPLDVLLHVRDGGLVVAHNAAFEWAIWNQVCGPRYGWPALSITQMRCTMAACYAMALPGSLEKAAAALGITQQKDLAGGRLMMQMSRPRELKPDGTLIWWDEPAKVRALYEYCQQDVRVEQALDQRLMPLSEAEQRLWEVDHAINQRGLYVDQPAILSAIQVVRCEADRLNQDIRTITANTVGFTSEVARLTQWIRGRGVVLDGLAKSAVLDALTLETLPQDVRAALLTRQEAGKTSTAKLQTMLTAASADGRVKNTMQYHGAGTGRWAGRRIQPHNLPRPTLSRPEVEQVLEFLPRLPTDEAIRRMELIYGQPLSVVSDCLRGMICAAPGNELLAGDYANIEGRGIAWLAGEDWKLDAFRAQDANTGPEIYVLTAEKMYPHKKGMITKKSPERQIGKVAELACGYQGGVGAFQTMANTYLVKVPDAEAEIIKTQWREAHPKIVQYWYDLDAAVIEAVMHPGLKTFAGPTGRHSTFLVKGSFLLCKLPSGRVLTYPYPKLKSKETPWGDMKEQLHYMTVDGLSGKWVETSTYGGKLAENITQAVCRDLLAHSLQICEANGYPVVLHVHDEIVVELDETRARTVEAQVYEAMASTPEWATGLPVVIEGWRGKRYRK